MQKVAFLETLCITARKEVMQNIEIEIKNIIAQVLEKDPQEILPDARFFEDLGMDSMMALEIMTAIEKKYKINIPEEKLAKLTTLNEAIAIAKEFLVNKGVANA